MIYRKDRLLIAKTDEEPVFAIDHTIAQAWWVKPFLKRCAMW